MEFQKIYTSIRTLPENFNLNDLSLFEHEFKKEINTPEIKFKRNIYVENNQLKKYKFFRIMSIHWRMNKQKKIIIYKWFLIDFINYLKYLRFSRQPIKISKAAWVTDSRSNQYFHWMTDTLQRIAYLDKLNIKFPVLIPSNYLKFEHIHQSLEMLNINYLELKENTIYKISEIAIVPHVAEAGNYNHFLINNVSNRLINFSDNETKEFINFKKVFISRQNTNKRKISNFSDVEKMVSKLGYKIVEFEKLDLLSQISLCNEIEIICGLHGAGLTNLLFLNKKTKVVEIRGSNDSTNNCFFSLSSDLNMRYYYFHAKEERKDDFYSSDYIVDVDTLQKELIKIEHTK